MARGKRPFRNGGGPVFKKARKAHRSDGTRALALIRAQLKEREIMYNDEEVVIGTTGGTAQPIARVSGGSNAGQRTGDKITLKSLYVRSTIIKPPLVDVGDEAVDGDMFHLALVLQKVVGDPSETPAYTDVFKGTPLQGPLYETTGRGEFTVLAQEKFILNQRQIIEGQGGTFNVNFETQMVDWYPKVKGLPQWYQGLANSSGYKNRLWIFARSIGQDGDSGSTQAHVSIRLGYTDTS